MAASTSRVTESVFASSCFSTISSRPGPSLMTASPMGGGNPSRTSATSPSVSGAPPRIATGTRRRSSARPHRRLVRHRHALVRRLHEAARRRAHRVAARAQHVVQRHAVAAQPLGIDHHLELAIALPPDGDVRHARDRHQPRANGPPDQRRQLHLAEHLRRDADLHHAARRRQRREHHRRPRHRRQLPGQRRQALLHELPRLHQVGAVLEDQRPPTTGRGRSSSGAS